MKKIAILGATIAQRALYEKARDMGLYVVGISQAEGATCLGFADVFYPVSLADKDLVVEICKKENVSGVVSNCSEFSARIVSYVAEQLQLDGTPYNTILKIQDKSYTRELANHLEGFSKVKSYLYDGTVRFLPCVVKPIPSSGKKGLSMATTEKEFIQAIKYAQGVQCDAIMVEEYILGDEVSVECISCRGKHYVVQITDKETLGAPHFVEIGHHQPSLQSTENVRRIREIVPKLLDMVGFVTGASHTELKIDENGNIYLIEINPRGGGDMISTKLVELSTGYDYIKSMIQVSLGELIVPYPRANKFSGIYFLMKQTESRLPFFLSAHKQDWFVEGEIKTTELSDAVGNDSKNGYLIYQSNHRIIP